MLDVDLNSYWRLSSSGQSMALSLKKHSHIAQHHAIVLKARFGKGISASWLTAMGLYA